MKPVVSHPSRRSLMAAVLVVAAIVGALGLAPAPAAAQEAGEWYAEYYANQYLIGEPALTRTEAEINFDWGAGAPGPGLNSDAFSARWTSFVTVPDGRYTFHVRSDDGVRLFVNEHLLIDAWQKHAAADDQATVQLFAGAYAVRLEYFNAGAPASVRLSWEQAPAPEAKDVAPTAEAARAPLSAQPTPTATASQDLAANSQTVYVVQRGDTLNRIATRYGVTVHAILVANPKITNPDRIYIGQRIIIPASGSDQGPAPTFRQVKVYLIGEGTGTVGCGDQVVAVRRNITPTTAPLTAALNQLLSLKTQHYGQSGLYNALYQSNLQVQQITRSGSTWTVKLTGTLQLGGVCDNPRVEAQLKQTALQFDTVKQVNFLINGVPLERALSLR